MESIKVKQTVLDKTRELHTKLKNIHDKMNEVLGQIFEITKSDDFSVKLFSDLEKCEFGILEAYKKAKDELQRVLKSKNESKNSKSENQQEPSPKANTDNRDEKLWTLAGNMAGVLVEQMFYGAGPDHTKWTQESVYYLLEDSNSEFSKKFPSFDALMKAEYMFGMLGGVPLVNDEKKFEGSVKAKLNIFAGTVPKPVVSKPENQQEEINKSTNKQTSQEQNISNKNIKLNEELWNRANAIKNMLLGRWNLTVYNYAVEPTKTAIYELLCDSDCQFSKIISSPDAFKSRIGYLRTLERPKFRNEKEEEIIKKKVKEVLNEFASLVCNGEKLSNSEVENRNVQIPKTEDIKSENVKPKTDTSKQLTKEEKMLKKEERNKKIAEFGNRELNFKDKRSIIMRTLNKLGRWGSNELWEATQILFRCYQKLDMDGETIKTLVSKSSSGRPKDFKGNLLYIAGIIEREEKKLPSTLKVKSFLKVLNKCTKPSKKQGEELELRNQKHFINLIRCFDKLCRSMGKGYMFI